MPNVCAYKSSTEGRVLISQVCLFLFAQTLITHSQGPGLAWWRQTMEVVTETIEIQPKFMGQVPCAPLKSVCEADAPPNFFMFLFPARSALSLHRQPERSFWNANPIMSLSMNPFHGSTLLCRTQGRLNQPTV